MRTYGLSNKGPHRAENQDSFDISTFKDGTLAVVCDGMGGAAAGGIASAQAVEQFVLFAKNTLEISDKSEANIVLPQAAYSANRRVYRLSCSKDELAGMGTTLVAGYFTADLATFVNIGDSRAYRVAKDSIVQITKDHSLVQEMVDSGKITPAQAQRHPRRNIITRALGSDPLVSSDVFQMPVREGDIFLLCSDGLTNALEEPEIHRLILASASAEEACGSLIQAALDNDSRDNVTAVIVSPSEKGGPEDEQ